MSRYPATIGHYLNGRVTTGSSARGQEVFNPATGVVSAQVALANSADVDAAVASAQAAFPAWSDMPPIRRARVMFKFLELLNQNKDKLAHLITAEHGTRSAPASTTGRCASRWAWWPASRHSTFR